MNCQCAERVTILSLCVCIGIAESWALHCLSRVSYRRGKKKKRKIQKKRKWWRLKHGFVCVCGKCVKYMCVREREGGKKTATVTYFWVISFQKGRESFCKIQWELKNDSSSVNAESRTLRLRSVSWFTDASRLSEQPLRCLCRVSVQICPGFLQAQSGRVRWWRQKLIFTKLLCIRTHFASHFSKMAAHKHVCVAEVMSYSEGENSEITRWLWLPPASLRWRKQPVPLITAANLPSALACMPK